MTDNGGGAPGNRGSEEDADSWFKPSENRNRTQSEYQDPLEQEGAAEGDAPAESAVFPDSGGYAGLSASRPAMVEPYPDALGGPPVTPPAAPPASEPSFVPGAISYPGAGTSAYQPVTSFLGENDPLRGLGGSGNTGNPGNSTGGQGDPEEPEESAPAGGYPGVVASAQVPLPPEDPESPSEPAHDSWATGTNDSWSTQPTTEEPPAEQPAEAPAQQAWPAGEPEAERPWAADTPAAAGDAWTAEPSGTTNDAWTADAPTTANDAWSSEAPAPAVDSWSSEAPAPAVDSWSSEASAPAADAWTPEVPAADAWTSRTEDSWAPQAAPEPSAPPVGEPWAPQPVQDTWSAPAEELWKPEPVQDQPSEWQGTGGLDSWSPTPDTGDTWKGAGTTEPWAEPATQPWAEQTHIPSYGGDQYDDELSPRPAPPVEEPVARTADPYEDRYEGETRTPSYGADRYDDELSPNSAVLADQGGIGSGSGNTWAFDRNDPRLPDVVRDAERRRRESAPEEPFYTDWGADDERGTDSPEGTAVEGASERDGGPDTGELSAAVATSADPLAAIADMQSRAKAKETPEQDDDFGSGAEQGGDDRPWDAPARSEAAWEQQPAEERAPSSWGETPSAADDSWRGGEGATQMFTAPSFDQTPEGRGYGDQAHGERPYGGQGYGEPGYDELGHGDRGPSRDGFGHDELGYDDRGYDDRGPVAAGVPSDLGSVPVADRGHAPADGRFDEDRFAEDRFTEDQASDGRDHDGEQDPDRGPEGESDYEDGFTPADYGMPDRPRQSRRRRDKIAEDFPGFDESSESGDYPGYDSIDFLADTEPGANVTLWLGFASLVPGLGVITAILALFVTGPKAKKAIRESRGTLDGLGLITTGTVFAVIGIIVTVISVAIWLAL